MWGTGPRLIGPIREMLNAATSILVFVEAHCLLDTFGQ